MFLRITQRLNFLILITIKIGDAQTDMQIMPVQSEVSFGNLLQLLTVNEALLMEEGRIALLLAITADVLAVLT